MKAFGNSTTLEAEVVHAVREEMALKLADKILESDIEDFIQEWYDKPLFKSVKDKAEIYKELLENKNFNSAAGLANSLKGFSTGRMNNHWGTLAKLAMPVLLITGEYDEKFANINRDMMRLLPNAEHVSVANAGHIAHLENAADFIILLNSFLSKI